MKVIHLISGGDTGGAKTHVLSLLHDLNQSIEAHLVCFREGEFSQEARELGIPTKVLSGNHLYRTCRELKAFIEAEQFDIIHCHGSRGNMMGVLMRWATGLPTVTTVHSDYKLDYMGRPIGRLTYGNINAAALRNFDYYIGVSDAMVDLLIRRGFPPEKFYAIYNGLRFDAQHTLENRLPYLRGLGAHVEEDSVVVGIAARLNPVKDIATLIRGFAIAAEQADKLRLVIAGDGQDRAMLEALAKQLGVEEKVCFAGWLGDMDTFYQAIDINTLTSVSETFPYALTEGARYALPTVSSRVGGVPYLIDHAVNGFLFPAGDAKALGKYLAKLANDPELRHKIGNNLKEKASQKYSLEKTVETQLSIYKDILKRHSRKKTARDGVLICGAYGKENAGDEAILRAIIREMREIDPYMPITVLSRRPMRTKLVYRVDAIHTFRMLKWSRRMRTTRLYISGGGSLIQDVTSRRSLWYYLYNLRAAKLRGNQVMMYGCGIGPVIRERHRELSAKVMNRYVDAITLREPDSLRELRDMGVDNPEVHLSADPALILPIAQPDIVDSAMLSHDVPLQGNYICFALRNWPGFSEKLPDVRAAAVYAYEKYGLTPIFLAVEKLLDPDILYRAAENLPVPHHLMLGSDDPAAIAGVLSRMKVVVSMRLHALIFAAGQGVPLVGIVYDPKVSSFLKYIEEDLYVDLLHLDAQTLESLIDRAVVQHRGEDAVERLLEMERINRDVAKKLYEQSR